MRTCTLLGIGAILFIAGATAFVGERSDAADPPRLAIAPAAADKIIDENIKELNKALDEAVAKKIEAKRHMKRAKVLAIVVAVTAQGLHAEGKGDKAKLAGQYNTAVAVLDELHKDEGPAGAKAAAAKFSGAAGGDIKPVNVTKYLDDAGMFDNDLAMQLFKSTRAGGLGLEKLIKDFAEKNPTAKDYPAIVSAANNTAMITTYLEAIAPKGGAAPKTQERWNGFVKNLRTASLEAASAAEKKNAAGVKEALGRMDATCVGCHDVFKPK